MAEQWPFRVFRPSGSFYLVVEKHHGDLAVVAKTIQALCDCLTMAVRWLYGLFGFVTAVWSPHNL